MLWQGNTKQYNFVSMELRTFANDKRMKLPLEYRWLKAHGFDGFHPWYFFEPGDENLRREFQLETGKDFYPFARRSDCDDVAGFHVLDNNISSEIISVHLTWTGKREQPGFPTVHRFNDVFHWLQKQVIPESVDWMSEEDLDDLIKNNMKK